MVIESFIDGLLIELAWNGDHEAIAEVCEFIVKLMSDKFSDRFRHGVTLISKGEIPNNAFDWRDRSLRDSLKKDARNTLNGLSAHDVGNDVDLFLFVQNALNRLKAGIAPNSAFNWNQDRRGRRFNHANALRDWDIKMTFYNLQEERYSYEDSCAIIAEVAAPDKKNAGLDTKRIERLVKGIGTSEPSWPDGIFPISKRSDGTLNLINETDLNNAKKNYKPKKIK